ncbi:MAG: SurA N-terminal domain-containing protein [Gammaproteobacteria bacterium]|nr:SurA N-terminal domain-containing protein [Gammaproteobacteria bacterium]
MLQSIREKVEGWIATLILGLITVPFALWGINSYFEGDSKINVAEVDGVKIGVDAYRGSLDQQRRSAQQMLGKNFNPGLLDTPEFKTHVAELLVQEILVGKAARDEGYQVGDSQLVQMIRQDPSFQRDGQFSSEMYQALLRRSGMAPRAFEARLRDDLVKRQFASGFGESALITNADLAAIVGLLEQKRVFGYVTLSPDKFTAKIEITPAAVEAQYAGHSDQYTRPERVRVEYLVLSPAELARKVKVGEDDLRKAYGEEIGRFSTPEQRRASHILVAAPATADAAAQQQALAKIEDIRKQLMAGAEFAQLAKQHSEDVGSAAAGGDLGLIERGLFPPEFEQAVLALKAGEVSKPVRSKDGYHLVKITSLKPEQRKPFQEVRAALDKELRKRQADEQLFEMSERLRTLVYEQADSLKPAAEALGLRVEQTDWFTRAGGSGLAADRKIVDAAFDPELRAQGRNSNAIDLSDNSLAAIRVLGHEPATLKPLAEVRAGIEQTLRQQAARDQAAKAGEALLAALNAGGDLEALAKQQGLSYHPPQAYARSQAKGIDPNLLEAVFKAARPQGDMPAYGTASQLNGAYAVFALKRVEPGKPEQADPSAKQQARQLLSERRGAGLYGDYRGSLRKQAAVKINPDKL